VLRVETTDPAALRAIRSAVDRFVVVFEPKTVNPADLEAAQAVLNRGDVVAVMMEAPAAHEFAQKFDGLAIRVWQNADTITFENTLPR
jgi:TusA-related sulfurtransferase